MSAWIIPSVFAFVWGVGCSFLLKTKSRILINRLVIELPALTAFLYIAWIEFGIPNTSADSSMWLLAAVILSINCILASYLAFTLISIFIKRT